MLRSFLAVLLLLTSANLSLAEALSKVSPACPGPATARLPPAREARPSEADLRALLLVARTVREIPGRQNVGEKALVRAGREARRLMSEHPGDSTLHALAGERDLLMVLYKGFPAGMPYGKKAQIQNDRALSLDSKNPEAHLSKGLELYFKPWFVGGSVAKSLKEFERANALRPGDPRILSWIGIARHRLGRPGARSSLAAALSLCPESSFYQARAQTFNPRAVHQ